MHAEMLLSNLCFALEELKQATEAMELNAKSGFCVSQTHIDMIREAERQVESAVNASYDCVSNFRASARNAK